MKALTIHPLYANQIFHGTKTIEVRSWKTKYRGEILICASKHNHPNCIGGHAYFTAELTDIEPLKKSHLEAAQMTTMPKQKCFAWHLDNISLVKPIEVRGMPGLFNVDDSRIEYLEDELNDEMTPEEIDSYVKQWVEKYIIPLTYLPAQL